MKAVRRVSARSSDPFDRKWITSCITRENDLRVRYASDLRSRLGIYYSRSRVPCYLTHRVILQSGSRFPRRRLRKSGQHRSMAGR